MIMAEQKNDNMQKVAVNQALEELPASPFIEKDLIEFIDHNCQIEWHGGSPRIQTNSGKVLTERIIELLKKHML